MMRKILFKIQIMESNSSNTILYQNFIYLLMILKCLEWFNSFKDVIVSLKIENK